MQEAEDLLPRTYIGQQHPTLSHNPSCNLCSLYNSDSPAVGGAGPDDLSQIKLVVISDYPGHYEVKAGFPMYDNYEERRAKYDKRKARYTIEGWKNAGATLRCELEQMFGLDTYRECWFTNAIRCNPQKDKPKDKHLKACTTHWLAAELNKISSVVQEVPILIAGSEALKAWRYIDRELGDSLGTSLRSVRRTDTYRWRAHPIIFTVNPAAVGRSEARIETEVGLTIDRNYKVNKVQAMPVLVGSPLWMFRKDLELLRQYL